jgi:hypothetical protein
MNSRVVAMPKMPSDQYIGKVVRFFFTLEDKKYRGRDIEGIESVESVEKYAKVFLPNPPAYLPMSWSESFGVSASDGA